MLHRRDFLGATVTLGLTGIAGAIEPIRRIGRPVLKLSLAAYSFRQALDLRRQPRTMTLDGFIDYAAELPFEAVELTGYYFSETTPAYLARLKSRCTRLGLDISGCATNNDFCVSNPDRRRQSISHVKQWIEHTARLGGKTLRIFAGNVERTETEEQARPRCIEAFEEVAEHAAQFGVLVALENHGGITGTPDQMLSLVRGVRNEAFGVNLDTGNFHTADPYADLERLAPYAVVVQLKTEIFRTGQPAAEADLRRLVQILRNVNYRGYVALEYEAAEDPRVAVPRYARILRELMNG